ncbi:MAG: hypothetical protein MR716_01950 [Tenericutes bacterium]|nr:hypothetical protein [Mycoplasmatota bacterium]
MNNKKIVLLVILFIIGLTIAVSGIFLILLSDTGNKISMNKFVKTVENSGCKINDKQENLTGNIKNQAISMDYGCPYYVSYIEFDNDSYQKEYIETNINKIKSSNGNSTTTVSINVNDYIYYTSLGKNYDLVLQKENMVVLGMAPKNNKDKLNGLIDDLDIKAKVSLEYAWVSILGVIILIVSIIMIVIDLAKNQKKKTAQ